MRRVSDEEKTEANARHSERDAQARQRLAPARARGSEDRIAVRLGAHAARGGEDAALRCSRAAPRLRLP